MYLKIVFPPLLHQFVSEYWTHMYKSLVFGDEEFFLIIKVII